MIIRDLTRKGVFPHGMTLIELMVVFAIVALLIGISFGYLKVSQVNGAARMIYYDLQYARMRAIKQRINVRVIFRSSIGLLTFDGHTYKIHDDRNRNNLVDAGENVTTRDIHTHFNQVVFKANRDPVFYPLGSTLNGTVYLTDGPRTKRVIFFWTGRVRIDN